MPARFLPYCTASPNRQGQDPKRSAMLELTVFLSGALVMVLEMVGARVLAPYVGTSAIVWTSLIGVVLACLALGAWAGGRMADRHLSRRGLALALAGAGLGSALTALCHALVGQWVTEGIGNLYVAAVAAAVGIFALPAFFFGMISPYAIRLRIGSVDTAGATVGRLYALSTAGSILGTFLGGFVLISFFGSASILWGVAVCMLALSLCNAAKGGKIRVALLALCLIGAVVNGMYGSWQEGRGGMRLVESPYNSIRIYEGADWGEGGRAVRLMATDPGYSQSGMYLDAPADLYFQYTRFYALGPHFVPQARSVLMLGGGGYSVPKWILAGKSALAAPGEVRMTVVEIDPAMTDTARRWFALEDDARLTVRHEDARAFLNRQKEQYDLVFVDVFNSHYAVPFQMGTVEAAQALRRAVAPGGALLMNVISAVNGEDGRLFQGIYRALTGAFAEVQVYCVSRPDRPDEVQNLMVVAFPEERDGRTEEMLKAQAAGGTAGSAVAHLLAARHAEPLVFDTPPLTDDFAPVERYALMLLRQ